MNRKITLIASFTLVIDQIIKYLFSSVFLFLEYNIFENEGGDFLKRLIFPIILLIVILFGFAIYNNNKNKLVENNENN